MGDARWLARRYPTAVEGWRYVVPLAAAAWPLWRWRPAAGAGALLAAGAVAAFFRDPQRPLEADPELLYSAADGKVLAVDQVEAPWYLGRPSLRISTFLSVFDVHVNRSPVSGRIAEIRDIDGGFAPAMNFIKSHGNRRREIAIETARGPIVVVQVAGLIARRIVGWTGQGDDLAAGDRLGMITFGSRTDVIVPSGRAEPLVSAGKRIVGARTPVARWL
ncbi:MAG: phosphatidylserine decarboxylase [Chloroflexota bacterium]